MPVGLRGGTVDCWPPAFGRGRARSPFTTAGRVAADRGGRSQYAQAVPPSANTTAAKLPLGSHSHRASRERLDARRPAVPAVTAARREPSTGTRAVGRTSRCVWSIGIDGVCWNGMTGAGPSASAKCPRSATRCPQSAIRDSHSELAFEAPSQLARRARAQLAAVLAAARTRAD